MSKSVRSARRQEPVCGHCRNLGLPMNHRLRKTSDPSSELLCPVLMKTKCCTCGEYGHTRSRCSRKVNVQVRAEVQSRSLVKKKMASGPVVVVAAAVPNRFSGLAVEDSDDEGAVAVTTAKSNVPFMGRIFVTLGKTKKNWADYSSDEDD